MFNVPPYFAGLLFLMQSGHLRLTVAFSDPPRKMELISFLVVLAAMTRSAQVHLSS
jgi:hypothetical protein